MSTGYIQIPLLSCDVCDTEVEEGDAGSTIRSLRAWARMNGWRRVGAKGKQIDVCPRCTEKERG